jgi:hypothetical protein
MMPLVFPLVFDGMAGVDSCHVARAIGERYQSLVTHFFDNGFCFWIPELDIATEIGHQKFPLLTIRQG